MSCCSRSFCAAALLCSFPFLFQPQLSAAQHHLSGPHSWRGLSGDENERGSTHSPVRPLPFCKDLGVLKGYSCLCVGADATRPAAKSPLDSLSLSLSSSPCFKEILTMGKVGLSHLMSESGSEFEPSQQRENRVRERGHHCFPQHKFGGSQFLLLGNCFVSDKLPLHRPLSHTLLSSADSGQGDLLPSATSKCLGYKSPCLPPGNPGSP